MKKLGEIVQIDEHKDNPLRQVATPVSESEFGSKELLQILDTMKTSLAKEEDGVAIAAPQIGISKRIFVVSPRAYEEDTKWKQLVFINPKIIKVSRKTQDMQEGCLSVRWIYGTTKRHVGATVEGYDELGNKFTYGASGLLAHIFQHEIDHLEGILFVDHGKDFEEYTNEADYKERKGAKK
jgi:peptide deformylase